MLTLEQKTEIEERKRAVESAYMDSLLDDVCLAIKDETRHVDAMLKRWYERKRELQNELCLHPLEARETVNDSNTGNYDPTSDSSWTNHKCTICGLRWTTGQQWKNVGGKLGLPDDDAAKER